MIGESKLMPAQDDIRCSNCFYFRMAETVSEVTKTVPYCDRRGRMMGWNPRLFMCGDFGIKDEHEVIQASLDWRWGTKA